MKVIRFLVALLFQLIPVGVLQGLADESSVSAPSDGKAGFALLKTLTGDWEVIRELANTREVPVRRTAGPARLSYRVVAGGSAVVETKFSAVGDEMISVFTMDGPDHLGLTHYCTLGNQPRMRFEPSGRPGTLRFVFAGGANFDPQQDRHLHEGFIRVLGDGTIEHSFTTYKDGRQLDTTTLLLRRKP